MGQIFGTPSGRVSRRSPRDDAADHISVICGTSSSVPAAHAANQPSSRCNAAYRADQQRRRDVRLPQWPRCRARCSCWVHRFSTLPGLRTSPRTMRDCARTISARSCVGRVKYTHPRAPMAAALPVTLPPTAVLVSQIALGRRGGGFNKFGATTAVPGSWPFIDSMLKASASRMISGSDNASRGGQCAGSAATGQIWTSFA